MTVSKGRCAAMLVGACIVLAALLACANFLAGAILFLSFGEHPAHAQFFTIERAYDAAADARGMAKVRGSAALALLACFGLPAALALSLRRRRSDSNLFGTARFANRADIAREKLDQPRGVVLGKFRNRLLRLPGYDFVLLAAPTRTGKGVGFCVPNLLQFEDSAVVLDIKGENFNLTSEFRRRYLGNEIVYFNPFAEDTHRWNPLSYMSDDPNFRANDLLALASIIYPPNEKEPFWPDSARNLFVGLGLLVLETDALPKTIGEILRQASGHGQAIEVYLEHVLACRAAGPAPLSHACRDSVNRFLGSGETALKGIVATFTAALTPFANPVIDKATSVNDFDLRDVRKKKMTIYLNIPAGEILQAGFIVNMFFSQLINENVKQLPEQNPALKYQCLLLLDEFTAMGKVAIIAKGVGYMAGYNLRLAIVIQDKAQLDAVYGKEDAHNIVSNMGAVIYFTPSQVSEAEEYSKMIGNNTVDSFSEQHAKGTLFGLKGSSGDSKTASLQSRAVMLPQELLGMSKDVQLIVRSGIPVIKADKIRYFDDPFFKERFEAVPMQEVAIGGARRKVPVAAAKPRGDWAAYEAALAHSDYYARQAVPGAADGAPPAPAVLPAISEPASAGTLRHAPSGLANAWADVILMAGATLLANGALAGGEALRVVDVRARTGALCWQVLAFLRQGVAASSARLPGFHYIARADTDAQLGALRDDPYLAALADTGLFQGVSHAELLALCAAPGDARPLLVLADAAGTPLSLAGLDALFSGRAYLVLAFGDIDGACVDGAPSLAQWSAGMGAAGSVVWRRPAARGAPAQLAVAGPATGPASVDMAAIRAILETVPAAEQAPADPAADAGWLSRAGHDPRALDAQLAALLATDWHAAGMPAPAWRLALAHVWNLVLPRVETARFLTGFARLALLLDYPGLAREAASHAACADPADSAPQRVLADVAARTGRTGEALVALRQAMLLAPQDRSLDREAARIDAYVDAQALLPWFDASLAQDGVVWLEPLGAQHAGAAFGLFRAHVAGTGPGLPPFSDEAAAATWIRTQTSDGANACCALLHDDLGLIGTACASRHGATARIALLAAVDAGADDVAADAIGAFLQMLEQHAPLDAVFSIDPVASAGAIAILAHAGFASIDAGPAFAKTGLQVSWIGTETDPDAVRCRFDDTAAALGWWPA
jgi:type IV secretion system protein VirD4